MSGLDDLISESTSRWADADRRAQGIADNGLGEAVKKYYTIYFPAGLVAVAALGSVFAMWAFGPGEDWQTSLLLGFALAGMGSFSDIWWFMAMCIVLQAIGSVLAVRQFRQAGRFLDSSGAKTTTP
jgi:uncharacterized membrane protein